MGNEHLVRRPRNTIIVLLFFIFSPFLYPFPIKKKTSTVILPRPLHTVAKYYIRTAPNEMNVPTHIYYIYTFPNSLNKVGPGVM